jgi:hypothetical protein
MVISKQFYFYTAPFDKLALNLKRFEQIFLKFMGTNELKLKWEQPKPKELWQSADFKTNNFFA